MVYYNTSPALLICRCILNSHFLYSLCISSLALLTFPVMTRLKGMYFVNSKENGPNSFSTNAKTSYNFEKAFSIFFFRYTAKCLYSRDLKLLWLLKTDWLGLLVNRFCDWRITTVKLHTENNYSFTIVQPWCTVSDVSILVNYYYS